MVDLAGALGGPEAGLLGLICGTVVLALLRVDGWLAFWLALGAYSRVGVVWAWGLGALALTLDASLRSRWASGRAVVMLVSAGAFWWGPLWGFPLAWSVLYGLAVLSDRKKSGSLNRQQQLSRAEQERFLRAHRLAEALLGPALLTLAQAQGWMPLLLLPLLVARAAPAEAEPKSEGERLLEGAESLTACLEKEQALNLAQQWFQHLVPHQQGWIFGEGWVRHWSTEGERWSEAQIERARRAALALKRAEWDPRQGVFYSPLRGFQDNLGGVILCSSQGQRADLWRLDFACRQLGQVLARIDLLEAVVKARDQAEAAHVQLAGNARLAATGQVLAGVAHELNSPLGAILMALDGAPGCLHNPDQLTARLARAQRAAERAQAIIQRLLERSRPQAYQPSQASLKPLVEEALELVESSLRLHCVNVESQLEEVQLVVDSGCFLQVLVNLLLNARQALELVPLDRRQIWLRGRAQAGELELQVEDSGPGVAEELRDRLFQPFVTTGGGSGLGLAICRELLGDFGGTIQLVPGRQAGACFEVRLPLQGDRQAQ